MNVLAIEGYYGGSHKAFLDGWIARSRHTWTLLTLPANKWKWRMRHGAITFAQQAARLAAEGSRWDVLFCSDMLNLAEFLGLSYESVRRLPRIVYFHENQLTYPVRVESERDYQYVMTNLTTALAAEAVWFNSAFHRDEFLSGLRAFLKRMPDNQPLDAVDAIAARSAVHPPGIEPFPPRGPRPPGPLHILWAARWEHDKSPEDFFAAMKILKQKGIDFRLSVIGEQFRDVPEVFAWAKEFFAGQIVRWGYQPTRDAYRAALTDADVVVSTARHEFFGLSITEAIAAGAYPLLPKRLAYPEILDTIAPSSTQQHFYDGTVDHLAQRLAGLSRQLQQPTFELAEKAANMYGWPTRAPALDDALQAALTAKS
jgi:glycosyltransferase involved in cell wall biosynthesis